MGETNRKNKNFKYNTLFLKSPNTAYKIENMQIIITVFSC